MKSPDGATQSNWYTGITVPHFSPLTKDRDLNVCVVGAGIAGLTTAYRLVNEGLKVIVLDEGPIGSGQTGRTSAHLASAIDDRFIEIEKMFGKDGSKLAYESHAAAIDDIEQIAKSEKIECNFTRLEGRLSASDGDSSDLLDEEFAAAKRAGVAGVNITAHGGIGDARCLRFPRQARFHPMKYLIGLANAITSKGGEIFVGGRVIDVQGADPKKKTRAFAELAGGVKVTADHIVVATNTPSPINDWFGIYTKQASYRTYMLGFRVPSGSIEDALYWDTGDPYHYVRLADEELLLVGGQDHKTGQLQADAKPFEALEAWARLRFSSVGEVQYRWSGQVQEPADGLGFIGRALTDGEEVYVITGDSGMGLTHGTLGARLVTDLIRKRPNAWEKLYDPSRKEANSEFVKENANVVARYRELLTGGEVSSAADIPRGQGAVTREGLHKIAVYKDDSGGIHKCSAVCTHLKCIVHWNPIEKSWDCPCHGSRFDPMGKVVMGPAIDDLPAAQG